MGIPFLAYLAGGATIAPFFMGLCVYRRLERQIKPLFILFGIHAALTFVQAYLALRQTNNLWTSHVYYLVEVVILLRVYSLWTASAHARGIFYGMGILYSLFWAASKLLFEQFTTSALYTPTVSRIILLGSTLYILLMISSTTTRMLYSEPKFWFAAGFLVIFAGSLMFYGFRNLFLDLSVEAVKTLWSIHWSVTIVSNLLHVIGFLCILRFPNTGGQLELAR
ncbi:MAG: hypothetical protein HBSIN02_06560 [Bacteroidia bacterium]|nr:MAG: hypothetical protein HBSIN02_06560 [Bacteroidia bacterium]